MSQKRVHLTVSGRVQGVFFRAFTEEAAHNMRLTGWVRNKPDHSVEILAEGNEANLQLFLQRVKEGPHLARVDGIKEEWQEATGEFPDFEILYWRAHD